MTIFQELKARGLVAQVTNEEEVEQLLAGKGVSFYIGFDATANSLHVGHYMQLSIMSRLQKAGHRPICVIGGGTTMVGDPSGRDDMRKIMTRETIAENGLIFRKQMESLIDFSDGKALMVDNADWLLDLNYIDFMRDIGVHFSVNRMLAAECYKSRLEDGLSFMEMNYMVMQSYDFLVLSREYDCKIQCGGNDQWSNIISGADLIRRVDQKPAYGLTFTLLTTSDGKKMGKTQKGAVWLDAERTSPYEFFQYWRNVDDADVVRFIKMLTFIPLEEIAEKYEKLEGGELNLAKEVLAYEMTKIVHGKENADKALEVAKSMFNQGAASHADMPTKDIAKSEFEDGKIGILDLLVKTAITPSKNETRRLVEQGGILINDEKITDTAYKVNESDFKDGFIIVKKGKKNFIKINLA